jgi:monofunctional biosynthetic peptidoglycan transglycosylase
MVYGVGHAADYYFGKPPSALTVRECAILASMLPSPRIYNPYRKMSRVMKRSDRILRRMAGARMITREEYRRRPGGGAQPGGAGDQGQKTIGNP